MPVYAAQPLLSRPPTRHHFASPTHTRVAWRVHAQWSPPDVADALSQGAAAAERFAEGRHTMDLLGASGGTSDRYTGKDM